MLQKQQKLTSIMLLSEIYLIKFTGYVKVITSYRVKLPYLISRIINKIIVLNMEHMYTCQFQNNLINNVFNLNNFNKVYIIQNFCITISSLETLAFIRLIERRTKLILIKITLFSADLSPTNNVFPESNELQFRTWYCTSISYVRTQS